MGDEVRKGGGGEKKRTPANLVREGLDGRGGGARTHDPLIKSQLLFQLSYASIEIGKDDNTTARSVKIYFRKTGNGQWRTHVGVIANCWREVRGENKGGAICRIWTGQAERGGIL